MKDNICGVGVIGCGTYCGAYLKNFGTKFTNLKPVACSDLNAAAAEKAAADWNIPKVCTSDELFADPDVDIVLILTTPASHYSLTMAALKAGKHVYCEKPLCTSVEQANEIVSFAAEKGLFVGSAPDTFLTPEFQTVRKLIDDGRIGRVTGVTVNFVGPGADLWHPNASFLYKKGGGPVLDMAPYYLTTLVSLLGPIQSIFCYANRGFDTRMIRGQEVDVEILTNYCGVLQFADGAVGNINLSFDEWKSRQPAFEIYGTEGVIIAPDPNTMNGPILLLEAKDFTDLVESKTEMLEKIGAIYGPESLGLFREIDTLAPRFGNDRGQGISDMADAIIEGRKPRVSAELCRHITEAINAFDVTVRTRASYEMTSTCEKPEALSF